MDSGFLYALFDAEDDHYAAVHAVREMDDSKVLIPDVVLVEATFLARRSGRIQPVLNFLETVIISDFELIALTRDDIIRARAIMADYRASFFDFVDCCVMALAERHKITRIYTIDWRDFRIFRPKHCEYLDILP
jgi:uncharacterized protein